MNLRKYSEIFLSQGNITDQYVYFESYNFNGKRVWGYGVGKVLDHKSYYIDILPIGSNESITVSCGESDYRFDIIIPLGW